MEAMKISKLEGKREPQHYKFKAPLGVWGKRGTPKTFTNKD
jgi:hypothetical protein